MLGIGDYSSEVCKNEDVVDGGCKFLLFWDFFF